MKRFLAVVVLWLSVGENLSASAQNGGLPVYGDNLVYKPSELSQATWHLLQKVAQDPINSRQIIKEAYWNDPAPLNVATSIVHPTVVALLAIARYSGMFQISSTISTCGDSAPWEATDLLSRLGAAFVAGTYTSAIAVDLVAYYNATRDRGQNLQGRGIASHESLRYPIYATLPHLGMLAVVNVTTMLCPPLPTFLADLGGISVVAATRSANCVRLSTENLAKKSKVHPL